MASSLRKQFLPRYTIEEWERWEGRWEIIDGIPYAMSPAPSPYHQKVNENIIVELRTRLKNCRQCKQYLPIDWRINDTTVVEPDVSVICKEVKGAFIDFPPEMIFEVLSPSTREKDRQVKKDLYFEHKVKYYVLVDTKEFAAEIFTWKKSGYERSVANQNSKTTFQLSQCLINFNFKNIWD
jgi:Uma2 family endonuclease